MCRTLSGIDIKIESTIYPHMLQGKCCAIAAWFTCPCPTCTGRSLLVDSLDYFNP